MDGQKNWVEIERSSLVLVAARPSCHPSHLDQDDDVEEEGGEDEENGGEDPDGQRSQTFRVRGGRQEDRGEHVHEHLGDDEDDMDQNEDSRVEPAMLLEACQSEQGRQWVV